MVLLHWNSQGIVAVANNGGLNIIDDHFALVVSSIIFTGLHWSCSVHRTANLSLSFTQLGNFRLSSFPSSLAPSLFLYSISCERIAIDCCCCLLLTDLAAYRVQVALFLCLLRRQLQLRRIVELARHMQTLIEWCCLPTVLCNQWPIINILPLLNWVFLSSFV